MSQEILLSSTYFALTDSQRDAVEQVFVSALPHDYDKTFMELEGRGNNDDDVNHYSLRHQGEVGNSFQERIGNVMGKIGPLLGEPIEVQLREQTISDERDQYFYAGPDASALVNFEIKCRAGRALEALGLPKADPGSPMHAAVDALLALMKSANTVESDGHNKAEDSERHPSDAPSH